MKTAAPREYLDAKVLQRIKKLDVRARLIVEGFVTGEHRSPYNGFAVEFATHREYSPGDETKHIDWKVWSKTDRLYIKEYEEETNLNCTFVLDCSKSMRYGEQTDVGWSKFDHAATAAASLAHLLQRQQDSVGLVTFNTEVRHNMPPRSHPGHLKRLVHQLEETQPDDQTDVSDVFQHLAAQIRRRGIIVLISDLFVDTDTLQRTLQLFRLRGHEVIVLHVMHGEELTFPFEDNILFKGLEIEQELLTDPRALRKSYLAAVDRFLKRVRTCCTSLGLDYVLVNTDEPLDATLAAYLAFRRRAARSAARR